MIKTILIQSWETVLFFNPNQGKKYYIPARLNDSQSWILPANFFIRSQEWSVLFELGQVTISLTSVAGQHICLKKTMLVAEKKQFEKDWLDFQSSTQEAFDLRGFDF